MSWETKIINQSELLAYVANDGASNFAKLANALIAQQQQTWPMLASGYESLSRVVTKPAQVQESHLIIQHNPRRLHSVSAKVDKLSIAARPCFLCPDALPPEEKGIAYGEEFILLCNPFPILDHHLVFVHRQHIEQKIYGHVETFLALARDLGRHYFVLYNGAQCGASAPDHLHFQACSKRALPIENDLGTEEELAAAHCNLCAEGRDDFELFTLAGCGRSVVVYRGNKIATLALWIYRTLVELSEGNTQQEPMVNLVATHQDGVWTVYLFPRARHRAASYFAEGDAKILVSPGAIDMAGIIVVPEHSHFEKITAADVEAIFAEVSRDGDEVDSLIERISQAADSGGFLWPASIESQP